MTANQSRLLGVVLLATTVVVLAHLVKRGDGIERDATPPVSAEKLRAEQEYARARARFEGGAFVQRSKRISDSESIEVIVIPEGYAEELDTRCIIYKNSQFGTSSISCTGVFFRQPAPPS